MVRRSDIFVFYDDVQYDKHGWRNRNRVKTHTGPRWLTIPVHSRGNTIERTPIDQIEIAWSTDWRRSHLELMRHSYARAPYYPEHIDFVTNLYSEKPALLADFTIETTIAIARELRIDHTNFVRSSTLHVSGNKTTRLIETLKAVGATSYLSGPSAREYIEPDAFAHAGIALNYIDYRYEPYTQLYPPYDQAVSILDLLFMEGPNAPAYLRPAQ
jgi:hypothetical protein